MDYLHFKLILAITLLKDCWPLLFSGIMVSIYMKIDKVMIQTLLGSIYNGYYSAVLKLSEIWFVIGVVICNSVFPAIINSRTKSIELYYNRLYKLFKLLVVLAYTISFITSLFSKQIIEKIYTRSYLETSTVLSIHVFSLIFVYLGVASGRWLIAENKTKLNIYRTFLGLIINILLNYFLIKTHGIKGAAYATLIAYIVAYYPIRYIPI